MPEDRAPDKKTDSKSAIKYVLVVGSDADSVVYTAILLQRLDYQICTAFTVDEAIDLADVMVPSLVITDLKTTALSAPQLMERLKQKPDTATIPVIIKSEHFTPDLEKKCLAAGARICLKKPVAPEDLYSAVQKAIEPTPRENIRIQTQLSVLVNNRALDEAAGEAATVISSRGMYIRTRHPFPAKTRLPVQIRISDRLINADAKVIYSHREGEGPNGQPGMGLYFAEIKEEDERFLKKYIGVQVTRGMAPGRI